MEYIYNTLLDIMKQHRFTYCDKAGLVTHGWEFETMEFKPDFSYEDHNIVINMQFIDFMDYIEKFDNFFRTSINEKFAIISIKFDREEYICKANLSIKL